MQKGITDKMVLKSFPYHLYTSCQIFVTLYLIFFIQQPIVYGAQNSWENLKIIRNTKIGIKSSKNVINSWKLESGCILMPVSIFKIWMTNLKFWPFYNIFCDFWKIWIFAHFALWNFFPLELLIPRNPFLFYYLQNAFISSYWKN